MINREILEIAKSKLKSVLKNGPRPYTEVKSVCTELGINKGILKAARKELDVKTINTGKTWLWQLPEEERAEST